MLSSISVQVLPSDSGEAGFTAAVLFGLVYTTYQSCLYRSEVRNKEQHQNDLASFAQVSPVHSPIRLGTVSSTNTNSLKPIQVCPQTAHSSGEGLEDEQSFVAVYYPNDFGSLPGRFNTNQSKGNSVAQVAILGVYDAATKSMIVTEKMNDPNKN